jgi:hypothetical protein
MGYRIIEAVPEIEVATDDLATDAELEAVDQAFRRAGFEVRAEAVVGRKSEGVLPWVIYVTLTAPIASFFGSFAVEAGKDAYSTVKRWLREICESRQESGNGSGAVVLRDSEGSSLILTSQLPEEALDALRGLDWSEKRGDYLIWSHDRGEWLDPLKDPSDF